MTDIGHGFTGMAELLCCMVRIELIAAAVSGACWGACCALRAAWRAGSAWLRRTRAGVALRAEVTRSLAATESYMRARSASAMPSDPDTNGQSYQLMIGYLIGGGAMALGDLTGLIHE